MDKYSNYKKPKCLKLKELSDNITKIITMVVDRDKKNIERLKNVRLESRNNSRHSNTE